MKARKNRNSRLFSSLLIFVLSVFTSWAQDVSFSQFYASPLYLNPAFAGSVEIPRFTVQYRNQWHAFTNAFNTYNVAFDLPVEKLGGGLGIFLLNDARANKMLNSMQVNMAYSVHVRLSENFRLNGGIQGGFFYNSLKVGELVFPDNLAIGSDIHTVSGELQYLTEPDYLFPDFSAGVMVFSERIFYGAAVHHLAEPQQKFSGSDENSVKLNRKYTVHFGARLPLFLYGHRQKRIDISPHLLVQKQSVFSQINYGLMATRNSISAGLWFRQNIGIQYDAVIFQIGFAKRKWQLTYSYDVTVSGLWGDSGGTSEISLAFLLKENKNAHLPFFNAGNESF
jgi:type IX secretion system PorP/SprF family membrane protein